MTNHQTAFDQFFVKEPVLTLIIGIAFLAVMNIILFRSKIFHRKMK